MAEAYVDYAIKTPNEYSLFYKYAEFMAPRKVRGAPGPIRESRPNFSLAEQLLAKNFGGRPEKHTGTALILWALLHGTAMLLLSRSIPEGHEEVMREACRAGIRAVLAAAQQKKLEGLACHIPLSPFATNRLKIARRIREPVALVP